MMRYCTAQIWCQPSVFLAFYKPTRITNVEQLHENHIGNPQLQAFRGEALCLNQSCIHAYR